MDLYPLKFSPIYKEKQEWGGRNLRRLFGRALPAGKKIGESWELVDLGREVSVVSNGPLAGTPLTRLARRLGRELLGDTPLGPGRRFPLMLKLLDANDVLSLQVHPDEQAARQIRGAALKTECWYVLESRGGFIYKGIRPGVSPRQFGEAIRRGAKAASAARKASARGAAARLAAARTVAAGLEAIRGLLRRCDVKAGDFHYMPAGLVHALGAGVVVAEVQTPSDTTYRATDWGRGRKVHVTRSLQCTRYDLSDRPPGRRGDVLLRTPYFVVARRIIRAGKTATMAAGRCTAVMVLAGGGVVTHTGEPSKPVRFRAGDTILIPAGLRCVRCTPKKDLAYLEVTFPA